MGLTEHLLVCYLRLLAPWLFRQGSLRNCFPEWTLVYFKSTNNNKGKKSCNLDENDAQ